MSVTWPKTSDILKELNISTYLKVQEDKEALEKAAREVLMAMEKSPTDYRLHIENVHNFMKALWNKYDCSEIFEILNTLTRLEPALLDLERDPEAGKRYRDHFVHLFHVFIFGLRVLSAMIQEFKKKGHDPGKMIKVKSESFNHRIRGRDETGNEIEFKNYSWEERLFYLWTLIATLHDIAIPITHLDKIREALNKFSEKFQLEISGPMLVPSYPAGLDAYLGLLSSIFEGKLKPGKEEWLYRKTRENAYIKGYLERLFVNKDHGVLGGFLVYKKIEEIFLQGKSKYKLDLPSFGYYKELVLEEDIARAALAISLHNVEFDEKLKIPQFMPIKFQEFPLTSILILSDTLQEYLRWEGTSVRGGTKLCAFPYLEFNDQDGLFVINCFFSITNDLKEQEYFCKEVKNMMSKAKKSSSGNEIMHAANDLSLLLGDNLKKKLHLADSSIRANLGFYVENNHLCTQTFGS